MTFPVEFSAEAEEELDVAAVWFDEQRPGLGSEFLEAIEETLNLLADWPRTGSIIEDIPASLEIRRAPVSRFRFHGGYLDLTEAFKLVSPGLADQPGHRSSVVHGRERASRARGCAE